MADIAIIMTNGDDVNVGNAVVNIDNGTFGDQFIVLILKSGSLFFDGTESD